MRISGLASGMDTEQIVKDLLKVERAPLDKLYRKKQTVEWQRDALRTLNTEFLQFRSEITNFRSTSQYRARQATSTDESKVSISASGAATLGTHNVSAVTQLAKAELHKNVDAIHTSNFDSNKSLYTQRTNLSNATAAEDMWKDGAVLTKNIIAKNADTQFALIESGTTGPTFKDYDSWSIKVDGTSFKVNNSGNVLGENEVSIAADGTITFSKEIAQGSNIQVTYIANNRTDTLNITDKTNSWTLGQGGAVNSISNDTIKLITKTPTEGGNPASESVEEFKIVGNEIVSTNGGTSIGTIDFQTGTIIFNENLTKPTAGSNITYSLEVSYDHKYTSFSIDTHTSKGERNETFLFSGNENLNTVISKINQSTVGVSLFYDASSGNMTLSRKETGKFNNNGNEIETSGAFLNDVLKFDTSKIPQQEAQNAVFEMNGLTLERNTNTVEMNGVTFTFKKEFTDGVDFVVSNDSTKVGENIEAFVNKYNELITEMNTKVSENKYRTYTPLLDEERAEMTEKQQELWDERAQSGLLRNDSILTSAISQMRQDMYNTVSNVDVSSAYNHLAKIGITTGNYLEGGILKIDTAQLTKAIEEDPSSVENLFSGEDGLASKLFTTVSETMEKIRVKAGNANTTNNNFILGRELDSIDINMTRYETRLAQIETRYWARFTAMEQAIQRANAQSTSMLSMFSQG